MGGDVRAELVAAARQELVEQGAGGLSLRAIARRAGVSHAAPKHHFVDRAGLLTVLAADGHRRLAVALRAARDEAAGAGATPVAALGRAYVDFGLAQGALFDLMFRPEQLHLDDPELVAARAESLGVLLEAVHGSVPGSQADDVALVAWSFAHGLVVLARQDGFAGAVPGSGTQEVARRLTDAFAALLAAPVGDELSAERAPGAPVTRARAARRG